MEIGDSVRDDNEDEEDKDDSGDNYKENEDDKDEVKVGGEVEVEQRLGMQQSNKIKFCAVIRVHKMQY